MPVEPISLTYRIVMWLTAPVVRWWGRLEVVGAALLDQPGSLLLMGNHDSLWDPVVVGSAGVHRRQVRALAKASLWRFRVAAWVLDRMGQIPIERGRGDLDAMTAAVERLRAGACIGVFPEGTVSRGQALRALSGAGRLALAVPGARVLGVRVIGTVDIVRFPRRPRLRVEFFEPADGPPRPDESALALTRRVMSEVRAGAPFVAAGRAKKVAALRAGNGPDSGPLA